MPDIFQLPSLLKSIVFSFLSSGSKVSVNATSPESRGVLSLSSKVMPSLPIILYTFPLPPVNVDFDEKRYQFSGLEY